MWFCGPRPTVPQSPMTKPLRGASFESVVNRKTALPRTGVARAWRSAAARWKAASTASVAGWVDSAKLGTAGAALSSMEAMVAYTRAVRLPGGAFGASRAAAPRSKELCPALLNVSWLWPLVSIQEGLPELPDASDRRAGGRSKVEVALASTHSLFDGPTRNSQTVATQRYRHNTLRLPATASACNSVSLAHALDKSKQCHRIALDKSRHDAAALSRHIAP
jgi:hypothetical protein